MSNRCVSCDGERPVRAHGAGGDSKLEVDAIA
jgi:hypothetical protein